MTDTTRILRLVAALALPVAVVACHGATPERGELALEPVAVHVVPVEKVIESHGIEVQGVVQPARQSFVSSRVVGPVTAVHVEAGELVTKDRALIEIEPQAIEGQLAQARGALAQAEAALTLAEKNFHRFERLHADDAASDLELDAARMQYEQASGAVVQAEGAVTTAASVADEAVVRAPFAARVVDRLVEVGDLAVPGRPLVRLESLAGSKLWLTVREADIARVHPGQHLEVRLDARPELGAIEGTVDEIVPAADPATHTFTVKVALAGADVRSGMSGRSLLPGDERASLVVPTSAVHRRGGLELVVVRTGDGVAATRAVTTGRELDDGRIEVLSGLAAGAQVAVDAPGPLADGTPLEVAS